MKTILSPNKKYGGLLLISAVMFLMLAAGASASTNIGYSTGTPADGASVTVNYTNVNYSINTTTSTSLIGYNWDSYNTTIYDSSLILMANWNNVPSIGDTANNTSDLSIQKNNGTCFNMGATCNYTSGKYGSALFFIQNGTYVNYPDKSPYDVRTNLSIGVWIYPTGGAGTIVSRIQSNGNGGFSLALLSTGVLRMTVGNGSLAFSSDTTATVTYNAWNYVAATYNGSMTNILLNGVSRNTTGTVYYINSTTSQPINVGKVSSQSANGTFASHFNGSIDELYIYNRTLSGSEILNTYYTQLQAIGVNSWYLQTNNTPLSFRSYSFYGYASDSSANSTSTRTINADICTTPTNGNSISVNTLACAGTYLFNGTNSFTGAVDLNANNIFYHLNLALFRGNTSFPFTTTNSPTVNNVTIKFGSASNYTRGVIISGNDSLVESMNLSNLTLSGTYFDANTIRNNLSNSNITMNQSYTGTYSDGGYDGAYLDTNTNATISGNIFTGAYYQVHPKFSIGTTIKTNLFYNAAHNAIYVDRGSYTIVENNSINGTYHNAIDVNSNHSVIRYNNITGSAHVGLDFLQNFAPQYTINLTVYGNRVVNGYGEGVLVYTTNQSYFYNNVFSGFYQPDPNTPGATSIYALHAFYDADIGHGNVFANNTFANVNDTYPEASCALIQSDAVLINNTFDNCTQEAKVQINSYNNGTVFFYSRPTFTNNNFPDGNATYKIFGGNNGTIRENSTVKHKLNFTDANATLIIYGNSYKNISFNGSNYSVTVIVANITSGSIGYLANGSLLCGFGTSCSGSFNITLSNNSEYFLDNYSINQSLPSRANDPIVIANASTNVRTLTSVITSTLSNVSVTLQTGGIVPSSPLLVHPDGSSEYPSYLYDSVAGTMTFNASIQGGTNTLYINTVTPHAGCGTDGQSGFGSYIGVFVALTFLLGTIGAMIGAEMAYYLLMAASLTVIGLILAILNVVLGCI